MGVAMNKDNDNSNIAGTLLLLQVPRTNDKKELSAEQMFASLHGLLSSQKQSTGFFSETSGEAISFEIAVINKRIGFYVWVPEYLKSYVEEQIYAQYPTVTVTEVEDKVQGSGSKHINVLASELKLTGHSALPIKTFQNFEVDPLAAITATLAKFKDDEEAWIQLVIRPAGRNWHKDSEKYVSSIRGNKASTSPLDLINKILYPSANSSESSGKISDSQQTRAAGAEGKAQKLAFEAVLRIMYKGNGTMQDAKLRLQSIIASYKQFNTTYLNSLDQGKISSSEADIIKFRQRAISKKSLIFNIEEIATLFHLPHTSVETPYILWALSQTAEPPASLPIVSNTHNPAISPIATTNFRGHNTMFGLPRFDRSRHMYIIGQTGVGKSGLLELMTISDIYSPYGFALIDPHGDYAQDTLARIPKERIKDVVYFNPADMEFPIAFNPMEVQDKKLKTHTCSELIGVLTRMFDSWGPRLEYILRYSILALLDYPDSTMLDITRILTDSQFRAKVIKHIEDPVVKNFWTVEFSSWNSKFASEAVAPVLNKVGAFTANPLVRNIIGQKKSSFNIRQIMDENKILIVNLSRGLVGEDNAALLGSLLVTKIQLAAMSRADVPASQRTPFYLYVDEFQNFATDSFATILSEARKYGLNLTVANQYIAQMLPQVKDAIFGNVGSIVAFRTSADDARTMQKYFEPKFTEYDLVHMHNRHFVINMTIEGEKVPAFSAITLNLPNIETNFTTEIIEHSRMMYSKTSQEISSSINEYYLVDNNQEKTTLSNSVISGITKKRIRVRKKKNPNIESEIKDNQTINFH
jgi:hypothetical protein